MNLNNLLNPKGQALKKWMFQLLQERYPKHDHLLEKLGNKLDTMQEIQEFGTLTIDLFEMGYLKCFNDYKTKLNDMGVKVSIMPEQPKN